MEKLQISGPFKPGTGTNANLGRWSKGGGEATLRGNQKERVKQKPLSQHSLGTGQERRG